MYFQTRWKGILTLYPFIFWIAKKTWWIGGSKIGSRQTGQSPMASLISSLASAVSIFQKIIHAETYYHCQATDLKLLWISLSGFKILYLFYSCLSFQGNFLVEIRLIQWTHITHRDCLQSSNFYFGWFCRRMCIAFPTHKGGYKTTT